MGDKWMVIPGRDPDKVRLGRIPGDVEMREAYHHATGISARAEG